MTKGQFLAATKIMDLDVKGDALEIEVVLACGAKVAGPWKWANQEHGLVLVNDERKPWYVAVEAILAVAQRD